MTVWSRRFNGSPSLKGRLSFRQTSGMPHQGELLLPTIQIVDWLKRAGLGLFRRPKFWKPDLRRLLFERDGNFHAELNGFDRASDDVGDQPWAFVKIDPGYDIGDIRFESLRSSAAHYLANHSERIDFTFSTHLGPFEAFAAAFVA
jgi:hypothetical protein